MKILKYPDPTLTTPCHPVTEFGDVLRAELDIARQLMQAEKGMGLAANQIGILKRWFIMKDHKGRVWEFVNPEIVEREETCYMPEGCLSAPGVSVQVSRSRTVTVKAQDRNGEEFTIYCEDYEAICIQHEIDHLDGKFFLDTVSRQVRRRAYAQLGIKK